MNKYGEIRVGWEKLTKRIFIISRFTEKHTKRIHIERCKRKEKERNEELKRKEKAKRKKLKTKEKSKSKKKETKN